MGRFRYGSKWAAENAEEEAGQLATCVSGCKMVMADVFADICYCSVKAKKKLAAKRKRRRDMYDGIKGCKCCWTWLSGMREKQKKRDNQLFQLERDTQQIRQQATLKRQVDWQAHPLSLDNETKFVALSVEYSRMSDAAIKKLLKAREQPMTGTAADLLARLMDAARADLLAEQAPVVSAEQLAHEEQLVQIITTGALGVINDQLDSGQVERVLARHGVAAAASLQAVQEVEEATFTVSPAVFRFLVAAQSLISRYKILKQFCRWRH